MTFTWKGVSSATKGIEVTALPPIVSATRRDESYSIPYRSGALHLQDGALEEILKPCGVYLPYEQHTGVTAIRELKAWLTGRDWVIFSNEPERKYRGHIISQIDWTEWMNGFEDREAQIIWECEPYAYHVTATPITVTSSGTNITNPGTAEAKPVLEVSGSGDAELMVGGWLVEFTGLTGTVYLDCEAEECYAESGGIRTNMNGIMSGDFPVMKPGTNQVSWTGGISRVVINPMWRDV